MRVRVRGGCDLQNGSTVVVVGWYINYWGMLFQPQRSMQNEVRQATAHITNSSGNSEE